MSSLRARFAALNIESKLKVLMIGLSATSVVILSFIGYEMASRTSMAEAEARLEAYSAAPVSRLSDVIGGVEADLEALVRDPGVAQAMVAFTAAFAEVSDPAATLQDLYITKNPHPLGEKNGLSDAGTGSPYDVAHATYHDGFNTRLIQMDYYDIFLIDLNGNLVYSVFKELDYATNLNRGEWKDTDLANVFRAARTANADDPATFTDFAPYAPSHGAPAAFLSKPIFGADGTRLGVLAIQMPIGKINGIFNEVMAQDKNVTAFVAGRDGLLRNDLPQTAEQDILSLKKDNSAVRAALSGASGVAEYRNEEGHKVVAAYRPFTVKGVTWAVVTEERAAMLNAPANRMGYAFIALGVVVAAVAFWVSRNFANSLSKPVVAVSEAMTALSRGELDVSIEPSTRQDELGTMTNEIVGLRDALQLSAAERDKAEAARLEAIERERVRDKQEAARREQAMREEAEERAKIQREREAEEARAKAERDAQAEELAQVVQALAGSLKNMAAGDLNVTIDQFFAEKYKPLRLDFNEAVRGLRDIVAAISGSTFAINSNVDEISRASRELATRTESSAAAINETTETMRQMHGMVEETTAKISNVRDRTQETAHNTTSSLSAVEETERAMFEIESSSDEIVKIISVLDDIAFQTNLLALNAGVEAARAGEAGRGFAVVASEVRALAQRATESAGEIGQLIQKSREHVNAGVALARKNGENLTDISKGVAAIASEIDEIAAQAEDQKQGINEVSIAMGQMDSMTQQNAAMFEETTAATQSLAGSVRELFDLVGQFRGWDESQGASQTAA